MPRFFYVYVLRSFKDGGFYIGSTEDLKGRFGLHNSGRVRSTRPRRPFELVFYEAYRNQSDAQRRERYFKTGKGRTTLNSMLRDFIADAQSA